MNFHPTAPFQITIDGAAEARPYWYDDEMQEASLQLIGAGQKHSIYVRNAAGELQHRIYQNLVDEPVFEGFDDLPDRIIELERLLENRYPDRAASCGAMYHAGRRTRHRITVWHPGTHQTFDGATFGEAYRAAYEHCRVDVGDAELASWIDAIDGMTGDWQLWRDATGYGLSSPYLIQCDPLDPTGSGRARE